MPARLTVFTSRRLRWVAGLIGVAVLLYFLPLFRVVSLNESKQQAAAAVFDAADYVDVFWQGPLLDSAASAVDAAELLAAFQQDFADTAERFGHRLGLGGSAFFLVSGQGTILAIDDRVISIALRDGGPAEIIIKLGPVFGNAIRDGSGLLDVSDFANVQDFNAISAEINSRVETQVFPLLEANATVGKLVRFVGATEVADSAGAPSELKLVPLVAEFP